MEYIRNNFEIILGGIVILGFIVRILSIGTPAKQDKGRLDRIKKEVDSIGGILIEITKVKRDECPFNLEEGTKEELVYVPYKVKYEMGDQIKEGWAILVIRGTLIGRYSTDNKWIMKL